MSTELLIEGFLSILLLIACGYGVLLNAKLKKIRQGQEDLMGMIDKFDHAALSVSDNISTMHSQRKNVEYDLNKVVTRAHFLMDELSVMVNAGDNIAGRLEGAVEQVRTIGAKKYTQDKNEDRDSELDVNLSMPHNSILKEAGGNDAL